MLVKLAFFTYLLFYLLKNVSSNCGGLCYSVKLYVHFTITTVLNNGAVFLLMVFLLFTINSYCKCRV